MGERRALAKLSTIMDNTSHPLHQTVGALSSSFSNRLRHPRCRKERFHRVACPLRVGGEVLPQVEEFKYLGVLFTSEGKMEREIDRRIGAASMQLCSRCTGPSW
ncbi:hypothetical protein L3Q82_024548 [Scortum barcoo]|uniref:Uncharacterized protein n=1 Tax=Scortum barcoo TaxID=214431 RepID=A0ACB8WPL9_9TELE|nr:hypothetical protein L3Q82_024548 [Scortum barcoo]